MSVTTPIVVTLDDCEITMALAVAHWRMERVRREGLGRGHGEGGISINKDGPGAIAELAVAKHLGVYWAGNSESWIRPDVWDYEVRATTHPNGSLIVYGADEGRLLLVTVDQTNRTCRLVGLCDAAAMRTPDRLRTHDTHPNLLRPNSPRQWWVRQSDLVPMET